MKKLAIIVPALVLLDQLTKFIFQGKLYLYHGFGAEYAENTGAAFGFLSGSNILLALISFIVIGFIFFYYKEVNSNDKLGLLLLMAGAIKEI